LLWTRRRRGLLIQEHRKQRLTVGLLGVRGEQTGQDQPIARVEIGAVREGELGEPAQRRYGPEAGQAPETSSAFRRLWRLKQRRRVFQAKARESRQGIRLAGRGCRRCRPIVTRFRCACSSGESEAADGKRGHSEPGSNAGRKPEHRATLAQKARPRWSVACHGQSASVPRASRMTDSNQTPPLTLAVPKGRILKVLVPLLRQVGIHAETLLGEDRKLVRLSEDGRMRFLLLKPDDVPTYVEYGSADLGVVGRDTLLERNYELYQPVDLRVGACRMVVAAPVGAHIPPVPRVATKYPRIAQKHFAAQGVQAEIIFVQGSVELAPVTGLSDLIVDLVETGSTLRENGLEEREFVCSISSLLVANRTLFKLHHERIAPIVENLRRAVEASALA